MDKRDFITCLIIAIILVCAVFVYILETCFVTKTNPIFELIFIGIGFGIEIPLVRTLIETIINKE